MPRSAALENRKTILVADDIAEIGELLFCILSDEYNVIVALDGQSAYELASGRVIDLLVTDILMPKMNGIELGLLLQCEKPETPILLISSGFLGDLSPACLKNWSVLLKPFNRTALLAAVHGMLRKASNSARA